MTDKIVVLSTCGSEQEAETIAGRLVERRLAACVNILPRIRSVYRWKGAVEKAEEWLLTIKTRRHLFARLTREIQALHSYDVPEVIALSIVDGSDQYLDWLEAETDGDQ
ncbi:MAG: divalent-cation tolerance protein CutA [Acidobacteria bacterium]|nr:divalent-cation tolerance protein CutA [Acidobacteriota bacterium]